MLSTEVNDAALAFGRALRRAPAVAAYRVAADRFEADPTAQQALAALQASQTIYVQAEQAGLTPSEQQLDQLRRSQAAVRASEVLMSQLRATNTVKKYLPTAAGEVSAALGADYASLIGASSGC
jgi:cell fate (sporulation/competence/biofilm development) regulator YlbF (YheA/YmcA/DUF963 family)